MEKKMNTLFIVSYDDNIFEHRKFKRELLNDDLFKKYFGQMFVKNADKFFVFSDTLDIKKVYLVKDLERIVGMIRIYSYHESGSVNVQYAVRSCFRNQGYGLKILKELSQFLIQNNIHLIEGDIDKNNIGSIKIATKIGYQKEDNKYRMRR